MQSLPPISQDAGEAPTEKIEWEEQIRDLQSEQWQVRSRAAAALGVLRDARAVPALVRAFKEGPWEVRDQVREALVQIGSAAVPPLVSLLKECDVSVQVDLIAVLGRIGNPGATPLLLEMLKSCSHEIRRAAIQALGEIRDPRAVPTLIELLEHEEFTAPEGEIWKSNERWNRQQALRAEAARALGRSGDARAVMPLISTLRDRDPNVRCAAIMALGALADPRAIPL